MRRMLAHDSRGTLYTPPGVNIITVPDLPGGVSRSLFLLCRPWADWEVSRKTISSRFCRSFMIPDAPVKRSDWKINMDQIISNLQNVELSIGKSNDELETGFTKTLNDAFSFDDNSVKMVGTLDQPWFRAKDVLKVLGYSDEKDAMKKHIQRYVPEKYKRSYEIINGGDFGSPHPINGNEAKEVYINEPGLYRLIMRSNKPNAQPFQDYVQDVLLPNMRKQAMETILNRNSNLESNMRLLLKQNESLLVKATVAEERAVLALNRLADMGIQLNETNEQLNEMNNKLDVAVEDRAPIPDDCSKVERFVFLKRPNADYPYYAIRAQAASTKTAIRKQEKEFGAIELLLDFETHPNTKTYYNRIKLALNKRGVKFNGNRVRIADDSDMTEADLIRELNKVHEQRRDV
ncbi:anti-repressor Ant [Diadromus pulchellus ascovirus 4a]|uniref:Complete DpAV4 genome n=1 Tax=Diadromus pulchellus ascovirus 4a TaxID=158683 RepID=F2NZ27_9VIRU|nr:anti-repressor Ant [Diadromus pulchellus ascovirus 4a]CCA61455.1 unnamed protein product [Diadromus pulchellus ascovirus 4a]